MTSKSISLEDFADISESAALHTWQDVPSSNMRIHTITTPDGQTTRYVQEGEAAVLLG